jgi:hypothetical protein
MVKSSTKEKFLNKNNLSSNKKKKKEESIADKKNTFFVYFTDFTLERCVCYFFDLLFFFACLPERK